MEPKTKSHGGTAAQSVKEATISVGARVRMAASQFCLAKCPYCIGVCSLEAGHPGGQAQHLCDQGHQWR